MATKAEPKATLSLKDFARAEKRANCAVCKLPEEIRAQIGRPASEARIPRDQQLRWIKLVTDVVITIEEFNEHTNGRHDAAA